MCLIKDIGLLKNVQFVSFITSGPSFGSPLKWRPAVLFKVRYKKK